MINQTEAINCTIEEYNGLKELLHLNITDSDWTEIFFDSMVEVVVYHPNYDKPFCKELDLVDTTWYITPNTYNVFHDDAF